MSDREIPARIIEQLQQTARETGKKTYLYYDKNKEWQASNTYWHDWIAYAYPGGRTVIKTPTQKD